eukprot:6187936-Pleurochrysis_carterae.AAC.2
MGPLVSVSLLFSLATLLALAIAVAIATTMAISRYLPCHRNPSLHCRLVLTPSPSSPLHPATLHFLSLATNARPLQPAAVNGQPYSPTEGRVLLYDRSFCPSPYTRLGS